MTLNQTRKYLISKGWTQHPWNPGVLRSEDLDSAVHLPDSDSELIIGKEIAALRLGLAVEFAALTENRSQEEVIKDIEATAEQTL